MMTNSVGDITDAIVSFTGDLHSPVVIRMLEDSYDILCIADRIEAGERVQVVLNGLLDAMSEAVKIALRKEISEPLSGIFDLHELSMNANLQKIRKKDVRRNIVETLLATIQEDRIVDTICEACTKCLSKMREMFADALAKLESLERAFSKGPLASQLQEFRISFTPQIRKLMVEGIALHNLLTRGPVDRGSLITQTRNSTIYDCTSERWGRSSPSGQCAVKVIERTRLDEARWNQTAVDLVNMMDITRNLGWSPPNLLRLYGWLQPEPDVLFVVMEKAERGLLPALQGRLSPMIRMNIALDVATGLKVIHDAHYVYEDLKPANILLMHDGTAKINMAKPEDPYEMTALGEPFHISPEMYQFHGKGLLASVSYDIYAFGMLFWVLCEGSGRTRPTSYRDMTTRQDMQTAVACGLFPERPPDASVESWRLMETCWQRRHFVSMGYILEVVTRIRNAYWN